ncbi:MAG: tRNA-binding protein [Nitriliruptoraceae bacterium]
MNPDDRVEPDGLSHDPSRIEGRPTIDVETFFTADVRVGTITAARPLERARIPALVIEVDFGPVLGTRRSSARITNYPIDDLVGRQVVGVVNLPPRRVAGIDSQFLVLGALHPDGSVELLAPDGDVPDGAPVA